MCEALQELRRRVESQPRSEDLIPFLSPEGALLFTEILSGRIDDEPSFRQLQRNAAPTLVRPFRVMFLPCGFSPRPPRG